MTIFRRNFFSVLAVAFLSLGFVPGLLAQTPREAGADLARRIVVRIGPNRTVGFKVQNLSSLKTTEVSALVGALQNELQSQGIRFTDEPAPEAGIVVTVSENLRGALAVAQIREGDSRDVVMVPFTRPSEPAGPLVTETVRLEKELLFEQEAPILDAAQMTASDAIAREWLLVLEPGAVRLLEKTDAEWTERDKAPIQLAEPWSRDVRGRLTVDGNTFWAYLPGMVCGGAVIEARLTHISLDCQTVDEPWPIPAGGDVRGYAHFSPTRNFFDGRVETADGAVRSWPPFFAAAPVEWSGSPAFVLAGLDGKARLFADQTEPEGVFTDWGSDIAALKTSCGSGWQVLATGTGDGETADFVRAFEVTRREAVAVSAPAPFAGPVTALWPAGEGALVVTHNRKAGRYEAYILTAACGR